MRASILLLAGALALAGCAAAPSSGSFVGSALSPPSSSAIAVQVAAIVAHALPPSRTTLLIEPPAGPDQSELMPALTADLRKWGFGLGNIKAPAPADQPVTFYVTPSGSTGIVLRVIVAGSIYSRLYGVSQSGALLPLSPLTVGVFT